MRWRSTPERSRSCGFGAGASPPAGGNSRGAGYRQQARRRTGKAGPVSARSAGRARGRCWVARHRPDATAVGRSPATDAYIESTIRLATEDTDTTKSLYERIMSDSDQKAMGNPVVEIAVVADYFDAERLAGKIPPAVHRPTDSAVLAEH